MIAVQDNLPVDCTVRDDVGFTVGELVEEDSITVREIRTATTDIKQTTMITIKST